MGVLHGLVINLLALAVCGEELYAFDPTWQPQFPEGSNQLSGVDVVESSGKRLVYVTQRGNATIAPILMLDAETGALLGSWGSKEIGKAGAHGIKVQNSAIPVLATDKYPNVRVWVDDFTNHVLLAFSGAGEHLLTVGTPGKAGNGTSPMQFDHLADSAVAATDDGRATEVYVSDGDGGNANRVVKIELGADGSSVTTKWYTGHTYKNPHSIALHPRTGLLLLADREQNKTKLLRASDGKDLGEFDCGIRYGAGGVPFGVRTLALGGRDLAFVAIMDNPQDGCNQRIEVLDFSKLDATAGAASACSHVQTLTIPTSYSGPHLLGIDELTGDMYTALVAATPKSTVLRFKRVAN
eukprot:g2997.t1